MEKKFKTFDKVLVRDHEEIWQPDLYGFWDKCRDRHQTMMNNSIADDDILPYEGNEYLVGTTDSPDEEVRLEKGEWVAFLRGSGNQRIWTVGKFFGYELEKSPFVSNEQQFKMYTIDEHPGNYILSSQVVKFSDFNPNDRESMKTKILCVKNGKVVRYKGLENEEEN